MKQMKKIVSFVLAMVMVFAMSLTAMAQDIGGTQTSGKGQITISNAANGETYKIYKLFAATVANGSIAYTGEIPDTLKSYFVMDDAGNISATDAAKDGDKMSTGLQTALKEWATTATEVFSAISDGTTLNFNNLDYGYYVITTTQGESAVTVTSTNPTATVFDKNSKAPNFLAKEVDNNNVYIGDTVTYTVTFTAANYSGEGTDQKAIKTYYIEDTLPDFLEDVKVTSVIVDKDADETTTDDQINLENIKFENKKITIDWFDENSNTPLYLNNVKIIITYTAKVTDKMAIAGSGNTNTVTVTWDMEDDTTITDEEKLTASQVIYTYAIALKKVDEKGKALAGATFQFPFYVKSTADTDGAYIYAGTTAGEGLTNTITTSASGEIVVKGLASNGEITITETVAPSGYNKLTNEIEVTPVQTDATTTNTTIYLDENGEITDTETTTAVTYANEKLAATVVAVVNKSGTELPSTGGIGTTIFYILGGILVIGGGVVLITKKRMGKED